MAALLYISVFVIQLWATQGSNLEPPLSSVNTSPTLSPPVAILLAPFPLEVGHFPQIEAPQSETEGHRKHSHENISEGGIAGIIFAILFGVFFAAGASYIYITRKINIKRSNSIRAAV